MSNSSRGIAFERVVRGDLEGFGWVCYRAAASKGPADVWALGPGPELLLVQAKLDGRLDPQEWNVLYRLAMHLDATPLMAWRPKRGEIGYRRLIAPKGTSGGRQPWDHWSPYSPGNEAEGVDR